MVSYRTSRFPRLHIALEPTMTGRLDRLARRDPRAERRIAKIETDLVPVGSTVPVGQNATDDRPISARLPGSVSVLPPARKRARRRSKPDVCRCPGRKRDLRTCKMSGVTSGLCQETIL